MGVIRNKAVSLHNIKYVPPTENLSQILEGGFNYLTKEIKSPAERAIATFLFMARTQPFYDANKRTASLMMNGCLMKDGYFPITVLNREAELFHKKNLENSMKLVMLTVCLSSLKIAERTLYASTKKRFP